MAKEKKIEDYTSIELRELAKIKEREEKINETPNQLKEIDWFTVLMQAEQLICLIALQETEHDKEAMYLYETLMETIYGPNIFDWINDRI